MLNPFLKLNQKLFDEDVEQKPTRSGYGEGLVLLGDKDPNVIVLTADLSESTKCEDFAKKYPERFFDVGVAEQNMAAVAAGMAVSGKTVFISSYATFSPGKNWETIRTTIVYNQANVKIAGHHSGVVTGPDGATHQATEDIAITRSWPCTVVSPPAKRMLLGFVFLISFSQSNFASPCVLSEKRYVLYPRETAFSSIAVNAVLLLTMRIL